MAGPTRCRRTRETAPSSAHYPRSTTAFTVSGSHLTLASYRECDYASGKGSFTWRISGETLRLSKIADTCGGRAGCYSGSWIRK
jgi:hypothetical protein